jgi:hypothetical protein
MPTNQSAKCMLTNHRPDRLNNHCEPVEKLTLIGAGITKLHSCLTRLPMVQLHQEVELRI